MVRPRGPIGLFRSRGPLSLLFYVAARDGLLVWRSPGSLAVLQPPGDRGLPAATAGLRPVLLRRLVRSWDTILFAVPPAVLLVGAFVGALAYRSSAETVYGLVALLLVLAVALYVAVLMTAQVVTGVFWFFREFGRRTPAADAIAAELMPGRRWTMVFCHHIDDQRPELLLRRVQQRLEDLLRTGIQTAADEAGVALPVINVTESLVCLQHGATTTDMRAAIAAWVERGQIFERGDRVVVKVSDYRAPREPTRIFDRGGFLFWYVAAEALLVSIVARFVADWEREACTGSCDSHPVTYESALRWLLQRLLFSDPYGLSPATKQAWTLGWTVSIMSLMGFFVAMAAGRQYLRARRVRINAVERKLAILNDQTRTLVMVATAEEHRAVVEAVRGASPGEPELTFLPNHTVTQLGTVSRTRLLLVQVQPGSVGPGSAAISAAALITRLAPDFLILVGICFGLRPEWQEYGDILVCDQLRAIDHRRVTEPAGYPAADPPRSGAEAAALLASSEAPPGRTVLTRGDHVTPSPLLLSRFQAVRHAWTADARIHFGPMLSASTLVDSRSLRDELSQREPDAIGGEMEGAGVYAAAAHAKVDWIVVKAISDWGFARGYDFHERAARNAATFVVKAAEIGAFDEPPVRGAI